MNDFTIVASADRFAHTHMFEINVRMHARRMQAIDVPIHSNHRVRPQVDTGSDAEAAREWRKKSEVK